MDYFEASDDNLQKFSNFEESGEFMTITYFVCLLKSSVGFNQSLSAFILLTVLFLKLGSKVDVSYLSQFLKCSIVCQPQRHGQTTGF